MASITSANAVFLLAVGSVFNAPVQLQGFATDDIFSTEALETAQVQMGVDGKLSAGFVYNEVKQSITLQADSASNAIFDAWVAANRAASDIFFAQGTVILRSIGTKWALTNGVLVSWPPIPDAKKLLQPRKFGLVWESVSPAVA